MADQGMQPEKQPPLQHGKKADDVTAMSVGFTFNNDTGHTVDVSVSIAGTGSDTATFNLFGGSNTPHPGPNNGTHLEGPIAQRPPSMSGTGPWVSGESYTGTVIYRLSGTTVAWDYEVPAADLTGAGPYVYNNNTMTRRN